MRNTDKHYSVELLFMVPSFVLAIELAHHLFGKQVLYSSLVEISIKDNTFSLPRWLLIAVFFLFINFLIYFTKEFANQFSRKRGNWITMINGILLVILLSMMMQYFSLFYVEWTIYPPLSKLAEQDTISPSKNPFNFITKLLLILQTVIVLMLLFLAYCWGVLKWKRFVKDIEN